MTNDGCVLMACKCYCKISNIFLTLENHSQWHVIAMVRSGGTSRSIIGLHPGKALLSVPNLTQALLQQHRSYVP